LKGKSTITPYLKSNPIPFLKLERNHGSEYQRIKKDFPELKVRIPIYVEIMVKSEKEMWQVMELIKPKTVSFTSIFAELAL